MTLSEPPLKPAKPTPNTGPLKGSQDSTQPMALLTVLIQRFFSNLGLKLILLVLVIQVVVTTGITSFVVNHQRNDALDQLRQELQFRTRAINLGIITETDLYNGIKLGNLVKEVSSLANVAHLRLVNRDAVVIASTDPSELDSSTDPEDPKAAHPLKELKQVLSTKHPLSIEERSEGHHTLRMVAPMFVDGEPVAAAEIVFSLRHLDRELFQLWLQGFVIALVMVLLCSWGLILGLNQMVIRPLRRLTRTTQQIALGQYEPARASVEGPTDEVGKLYLAIDNMAGELKAQQQRLLEQERYRQELEVGNKIQMSMLPQTPPVIPGLDIAFYFNPADEVGGDYYDLIPLGDRHLAVAVGDVNGHGLGAALLMAMAKSAFHTQVGREPDVAQVMSGLNEMVYSATAERRFMTFFYALIDLEARTMVFANAGHHYPYHYRAENDAIESLEAVAYPLGVRPKTSYALKQGVVGDGDVLVFYSDGIVEAKAPDGEEFGFDRLEQIIWTHKHQEAGAIREQILRTLEAFQAGGKQEDDVTLVVLKFVPRNA